MNIVAKYLALIAFVSTGLGTTAGAPASAQDAGADLLPQPRQQQSVPDRQRRHRHSRKDSGDRSARNGVGQNDDGSGGMPRTGASGPAYGAPPYGYYRASPYGYGFPQYGYYDQYGCPLGMGYSIFLGRCGDMSEFFTQFEGK